MNLNIYIEDDLNNALINLEKVEGKSRNAMIREAIKQLVAQHQRSKWPISVTRFKGDPEFKAFESYRADLKPPKDAPFS